MKTLDRIKSAIMAFLGLTILNKSSELTAEQQTVLKNTFGEENISKFFSALDEEANFKELQALNHLSSSELETAKTKLQEKQLEIERLQKVVKELSELGETEIIQHKENMKTGTGKLLSFKQFENYIHNINANALINGKVQVTASTIDKTELATEFGSYVEGANLEILKALTQKTESMQYMTTKFGTTAAGSQTYTEWRAAQSLITSVVQQFVAKWTPLGQSKFTPITIKNYRHKINVPITPDDVWDSWLAYLYDEGLTPSQMPITKWIVNELIIPKIEEDRELKLIGKGRYEALGTITENSPGQATGKSMDGFLTILEKEKALGTSSINFANLGTITEANIVDKFNDFVDTIDALYAQKDMPIYVSRETYKMYKRAYQKLYPTTKNNDKNEDYIDFSNNRLVVLPSMAGSSIFFSTPKENFVRLISKNTNSSKLFMQEVNYDVKVFGEYWEGVGFAIGEAVFAYVPDESSTSGSGS